jgi:hypothetical protein
MVAPFHPPPSTVTTACGRYNLYVDCMPVEDTASLPVDISKRVQVLVRASVPSAATDDKITALLGVVGADFMRTMNKIIFDLSVNHVGC